MSGDLPANYNPALSGCTAEGCGTQLTTILCGRYGRRCASHAPWLTLAADGRVHEAFAVLRAWLAGGR